MNWRIAPRLVLLLLGGCAYHVAEQTDRVVSEMARTSYDREPADFAKQTGQEAGGAVSAHTKAVPPVSSRDAQTTSYLEQAPPDLKEKPPILAVPPGIPGTEVPPFRKLVDPNEMRKELNRLYAPLPGLPEEPKPLPGPNGKAYSLADFQQMGALNNPALKQAASDVKAAEGNLVQARTYQNPTLAYSFQPSNDGETAGVHGIFFDQKIGTAGKMKLQISAAQKDLDNAELALKRARSDLATQIRQAYFGVLVAKETVRVNRALSVLTDEIYRYQANLLQKGGFAASYEPASLRAQAYAARLAHKQSITSYFYAWKGLVTAAGVRQLPLSEVSGRVDGHIPYFDYDRVLKYVLAEHTDIWTAKNGVVKARYNRMLAQVTPFSDVDFQIFVGKDTSLVPFQWQAMGQVGVTLPIWDQNRGNIMAAEAAEVRAKEQQHVAELNLTNNLQNAYTLYKNNLDGLEYYRRYILPDQVRAYRGVLDRRRDDPNSQFGDLVAAQQSLASGVSTYLTILGQLWTSAVTVADFLQTDDLFQLADPKAVPALPEIERLPCCHPGSVARPDCMNPAVESPGAPIAPWPTRDERSRAAPGAAVRSSIDGGS